MSASTNDANSGLLFPKPVLRYVVFETRLCVTMTDDDGALDKSEAHIDTNEFMHELQVRRRRRRRRRRNAFIAISRVVVGRLAGCFGK